VFVAVDVHYPRSGGARAAAVMAAAAAFSGVLAARTEVLAGMLPYRPGEFYLRELPPLRAVPLCIGGLGLLVVDGYADLDPAGRPGLGAYAHPGDRRDQVRVPHGHPRRAGLARNLRAPVVRHRWRDGPHRGSGPGPAHGQPVPAG
jgi:hypothetical protein